MLWSMRVLGPSCVDKRNATVDILRWSRLKERGSTRESGTCRVGFLMWLVGVRRGLEGEIKG